MRASGPVERVVGQLLSLVHSLDYLVCSNQERRRDGKPEPPGCLEVDDQLELGWLFNGQVASSGAFEDPVDVGGCAFDVVDDIRPLGHEAACHDELPDPVQRRKMVGRRELGKPRSANGEHRVDED